MRTKKGLGRVGGWACVLTGLLLAAVAFLAWPSLLERHHLRRLDGPDRAARRAAALRLGELGSLRAVPRLFELLRTEGGAEYRDAIVLVAARRSGRETEELVGVLEKRIDAGDWRLREAAVRALGELGRAAAPAAGCLARARRDGRREVREAALGALARVLELRRDVLELLGEYDTVVVGEVRRVALREDGDIVRGVENWAITVEPREALQGVAPSSPFTIHAHSPIEDFGTGLGERFERPLVWLLRTDGGRIVECCTRLDRRFDPRDVEEFRRAVSRLRRACEDRAGCFDDDPVPEP